MKQRSPGSRSAALALLVALPFATASRSGLSLEPQGSLTPPPAATQPDYWGQTCDLADGQPLSGVEVTLFAWRYGAGYASISTTTSSEDGSFRIALALLRDVVEFELHLRREGYLSRRLHTQNCPTAMLFRSGGPLGRIGMQPGFLIEGKVYLPAGLPASGGHVLCVEDFAEFDGWRGSPAYLPQALPVSIASDGSFRAYVRGKRVSLLTTVPGFMTHFSGPMHVTASPPTSLTVHLPDLPARTGRVVDEERRPIANAVVHQHISPTLLSRLLREVVATNGSPTLSESSRNSVIYGLSDHVWSFPTVTGADGRFEVNLLDGDGVHVCHPDFAAPAHTSVRDDASLVVRLEEGTIYEISDPLLAEASPYLYPVNFLHFFYDGTRWRTVASVYESLPLCWPGYRLHRKPEGDKRTTFDVDHLVVSDRVRVRVVDAESGLPLSGVGISWNPFPGFCTSNPAGLAELGVDLDLGELSLDLRHPGYEHVALEYDRTSILNLNEIRLTRTAEVRGRVLHHDGRPMAGALASVEGELLPVISDLEGRFRISGVETSGPVRLCIRTPAPSRHQLFVELPALSSGESHTLPDQVIPDSGRIRGIVVDETTGKPISGAHITINSGGTRRDIQYVQPRGDTMTPLISRWATTTDADGTFELRGLLLEAYEVVAWKDSLGSKRTASITVRAIPTSEPVERVTISY